MEGFLTDAGIGLTMEHCQRRSVMRHTHAHPQYELYFCPQKVAQLSVINGVEYNYTYPCVILSAPFTVHSMSCNDPAAERYERYVFYFDRTLLSAFDAHLLPTELLGRNTSLLFGLSEGQAAYLKRILMLCEPQTTQAQRELTFALFWNKLIELCPKENVVQVGTSSFYIRDVLQYIAEEYRSPMLDADRVAKHFAVSRSKLDRDFKRFTGVTVHGFTEICRLNQAKYLLQIHRSLSIGAVAEQSGFESETYFFPFFKKHTGQTPAEFRRQSGEGKRVVDESDLDRSLCGNE